MSDAALHELPAKVARLFEPSRYKILDGGRGGMKSWSVARALLLKGAERRLRWLCCRETQLSIAESVHYLMWKQVSNLGLDGFYRKTNTSIFAPNGTEFIYMGIRNDPNKIKSLEGLNGAWVEEAAKVSDDSWEVLIPTLRDPGSEIWISFNPDLESDPTYQRFVKNPPPDSIRITLNWRDNLWISKELLAEKDYLYATDPEAAAHVWGGECRRYSNAQVLKDRYVVQEFAPVPGVWDGPYQGVDWGFSVDPTVMVRCWVFERRLYIELEAYGHEVELDHLGALFDAIPDARRYVSRADNARPETISKLVRDGWRNMVSCAKWPGCVDDRVEFLRSFEQIVIHPQCPHTAEEARLWSFKVDRLSGDVLPVLVDKHNHCWDAVGYALEPLILGWAKNLPDRRQDDEGRGDFVDSSTSWMM